MSIEKQAGGYSATVQAERNPMRFRQISGLLLICSDCIYRRGSRYPIGAHRSRSLYCRTPRVCLEKGVQVFGSFLEGLRGDCLGCGGDFLTATGISTTFREAG